jgi:hypothetical protein
VADGLDVAVARGAMTEESRRAIRTEFTDIRARTHKDFRARNVVETASCGC